MVSGRQLWICGDIHGEVSALVRYGSSKRVWWPDEAPTQVAVGSVPSADSTGSSTNSGTLSPTELTEAADILVSHEAPFSFDPPLVRTDHIRDETWLKIVEFRKYLDYVLPQVKPALWFYGHYHKHFEGIVQHDKVPHDTAQQTRYQCLDIAEMLRVV